MDLKADGKVGVTKIERMERDRQYRQLLRETGADRQPEYKKRVRHRSASNTSQLQFIGWDGEGVTDPDNTHRYILFGCANGEYITGRDLGTIQCFELMLTVADSMQKTVHTIYGGSYDVNMMLKDVDIKHLWVLYKTNRCFWNGYHLEYIPRKYLDISHRSSGRHIRLYDVVTYFACPFVDALRTYLPDIPQQDMDRLTTGKGLRSDFSDSDINDIIAYWQTELRYLSDLCSTLRDRLVSAGLHCNSWHGPGAVANVVYRTRGIEQYKEDTRADILPFIQSAYAGGHFEQFKVGRHNDRVYEYDIRSAYPYAISQLPSLSGARWVHCKPPTTRGFGRDIRPFQLLYVRYDNGTNLTQPHPFFWRDRKGNIAYPAFSEGWKWGTEVKAACFHNPEHITILDAYELIPASDVLPFDWVKDMYAQRAQWKRDGNPAQLALKLALNSLYGKMIQQQGWKPNPDGTVTIPKWHQMIWGSWVTANTRAKLWYLMLRAKDDIIAVETDAVFSRVPIDCDEGPELGQWERTTFDGILYLQSGVYWYKAGDDWHAKYRGFDRGSLKLGDVENYLLRCNGASKDSRAMWTVDPVVGACTRFVTMGKGLGKPTWRQWFTEDRDCNGFGLTGKRFHEDDFCNGCSDNVDLLEGMHELNPHINDRREPSAIYPLEWIDNDGQRLPAHDSYEEDNAWLRLTDGANLTDGIIS